MPLSNRSIAGIMLLIVGAILYLPIPIIGQLAFFTGWLILGHPIGWRSFVAVFVFIPLFLLVLIVGILQR